MARAAQQAGGSESIMGYFRPILEANPKLLKNRKNDELYAAWLKDHPEHQAVPEQVRNGLSNLKSVMRKKLGKRKGKRGQPAAADGTTAPVKRVAPGQLERLEAQIDECLARVKQFGVEGLSEVSQLLRRARNRVVVAQMPR
jgi:hypothetical protein